MDERTYRYDTYCGLYCGACEILRANLENCLEEKAAVWGADPALMRCHGCKSGILSVYCRKCDLRDCAVSKGLEYCYECTEFPCQRIEDFSQDNVPHHLMVIINQKVLAERGCEQWLEDQRIRWSCTACGEPFSWYQKSCTKCGSDLFDCEKEASDYR